MNEIKIAIKVVANAKCSKVTLSEQDHLVVYTTATPEKGKANHAVIALLSDLLSIPKRSITIIRGATSSRKVVHILGRSEEEIRTIVRNKK